MQIKAPTQQQMLAQNMQNQAWKTENCICASCTKGGGGGCWGGKNLAGQCAVKPGLTVGSKIPAWQRCNFIYHASAHTKSDMDAPYSATCVKVFSGVGRGLKTQQGNTGSGGGGGGGSISTVVGAPHVEQILHARAGRRRWIHRGWRRGKEGTTGEKCGHGRALAQQRRAGPNGERNPERQNKQMYGRCGYTEHIKLLFLLDENRDWTVCGQLCVYLLWKWSGCQKSLDWSLFLRSTWTVCR